MVLMNVETKSGWRFYGVTSERELEKRLREHGLTRADITRIERVSTSPAKYNLDTVYFAGVRDEVKQRIASSEREKYYPKARQLIAHYQNVIKSLQESARKYPKAAAGLEKSIQMYQQRIADLKKYLSGGEAPAWFARLMVHEVTSKDLARLPDKTKKAINMKTGFYVPVNVEKEKERWLHPAPNPTVHDLVKNTGIKTVPSPKPPEKAKIVSVSQVKQGVSIDWRKVGLIVGILAGVYFLTRRR